MNTIEERFGFALFGQRDIDITKQTPQLPSADLWQTCMQCGSCSATCTASAAKTDLRKAILQLQRGLVQQAQASVKNCLFCGKCAYVCPRGISTRHIVATINQHIVKTA
jgi:heterodisulfide reductase subunit C